jgi:hypothetical protein
MNVSIGGSQIADMKRHTAGSVGAENDQPRRLRWVRVVYLVTACVAFGLSIVARDPLFGAGSGFVLITALLGALLSIKRERGLGPKDSSVERGNG